MRWMGLMCGAAAPLLLAAAAEAATLTIAPTAVLPSASQQIQILVSGGEQVFGLDLYLQIEDGGADLGGSATAPVITDVDLLTGTIFAANNAGQTDSTVYPMAYGGSTTTNTGTAAANGVLATITLDCSALSEGDSFVLMTRGVAGEFDTQLTDVNGIPITLDQPAAFVFNQWIPEPTTFLTLSALSSIILLRPRSSRA